MKLIEDEINWFIANLFFTQRFRNQSAKRIVREIAFNLYYLVFTESKEVKVLDLGTGFGEIPQLIARMYKKITIVLVDPNTVLSKAVQNSQAAKRMEFFQMGYRHFLEKVNKGERYEFVTLFNLLQALSDKEKVNLLISLKNITDAIIVVDETKKGFISELRDILLHYAINPVDIVKKIIRRENPYQICTWKKWREIFEKAGWTPYCCGEFGRNSFFLTLKKND